MNNILWFWMYNDITEDARTIEQIMQETKEAGFNSICYSVGGWSELGKLNFQQGKNFQTDLANELIPIAHSFGLEVYSSAFALYNPPYSLAPDLKNSSIVQSMQNELPQLAAMGFDGHIDDIENYYVEPVKHAEWLNNMGRILHGYGLKSSSYYSMQNINPHPYRDFYANINANIDFLVIRFYHNKTETIYNSEFIWSELNQYLPSSIKWMSQLRASGADTRGETIIDGINFYNQKFGGGYPQNFEGFTVWCDHFLTGNEKELWVNWISGAAPPTPEPEPPPTPEPEPTPPPEPNRELAIALLTLMLAALKDD